VGKSELLAAYGAVAGLGRGKHCPGSECALHCILKIEYEGGRVRCSEKKCMER